MIAIFLVVVQHIAFLGGLGNEGMGAFHRLQARFLEAASQSCVDIFGLLSGYLGVTAVSWKWRRFGRLYLQVWMTGLLVVGALAGLSVAGVLPSVIIARGDWLTALFPILRDEYWYFTGYVFVFLLAPLINRGLFAEGRTCLGTGLALALFLVIGIVTAYPGGLDCLPLRKGYSGAWLVCLYLFGAALRRNENRLRGPSWVWFGMAGLCVAVTAGQRLLLASVPTLKSFFADEWTLSPYTSPTVVAAAVAVLLGCARLPNPAPRVAAVISGLASCAFGVYLFHVQPVFFASCFKRQFAFLDALPDGTFGLGVLATAAGVYLLCSAVEWGRRKIEERIVR